MALDGTGEHSPFTAALLDHIGTPGLEVRQVLGRVRGAVLDATGDRQVPWDSSSLRGEFYFLRPSGPAPGPPSSLGTAGRDPLPSGSVSAPVQARPADAYGGDDQTAFGMIRDSGRARGFELFLQRYPASPLTAFAQSRLEEMKEAADPPRSEPVKLSVSAASLVGGDPGNGRSVLKRCQACHVINQPTNRVGPHLVGNVGRPSGSVDGFRCSDAMKNAGKTRDEATLDAYLADPKGYLPGNKMAFPGLKRPEERADVIAYLKQAATSR